MKGAGNGKMEHKKATPTKALPVEILKNFQTGPVCQSGERQLSPPAAYTGGCLSAAERSTGPVFWQLKRVRVYAGAC